MGVPAATTRVAQRCCPGAKRRMPAGAQARTETRVERRRESWLCRASRPFRGCPGDRGSRGCHGARPDRWVRGRGARDGRGRCGCRTKLRRPVEPWREFGRAEGDKGSGASKKGKDGMSLAGRPCTPNSRKQPRRGRASVGTERLPSCEGREDWQGEGEGELPRVRAGVCREARTHGRGLSRSGDL